MARAVIRVPGRVLVSPQSVRHIPARPLAAIRTPGVEPAGPSRMLISCYIYHTWTLSDPLDWQTSTLVTSFFKRGYNFATWRTAMTERITARGGNVAAEMIENGGDNTVQFRGEAFFDFCSLFDMVMVRPGTPAEHIAEIKARSLVGTKVRLGLLNFESMGAAVGWTSADVGLNAAQRPYVLAADATSGCNADGKNAYGCTVIDKYEHIGSCSGWGLGDATPGTFCSPTACQVSPALAVSYAAGRVACPHTPAHAGLPANCDGHSWDCDVRNNTYSMVLLAALINHLPVSLGHDGHLWDNVLENPYRGSASNNFPSDYTGVAYRGTRHATPSLRTGWKGFLQTLQEFYTVQGKGDSFLWGNGSDNVGAYGSEDLKNRFIEHFFGKTVSTRKTLAEMRTILQTFSENGMRIEIGIDPGWGQAVTWATTAGPGGIYGNWTDIFTAVQEFGLLGSTYVQCARSSTGFYLYWQPQFRDLR